MKIHILTTFIFLLATTFVSAQNTNDTIPQPYVKTWFVIVRSTTDYEQAKTTAIQASKYLGYKLDLRELTPHKTSGLTFSSADCENNGGYPCYVARGRYDAGNYVSIEWSDAYQGFAKGYYIVIVSSGDKRSTANPGIYAKKIYGTSYRKAANVYVGCMH